MKRTKKVINISIDKKLDDYMNDLFDNKSKYIECLILRYLKKSLSDKDLQKIINL
ncbi:hypothetical protein M0Q50_02640 [bacterium]|nr:hypothetical protein [bacterium]